MRVACFLLKGKHIQGCLLNVIHVSYILTNELNIRQSLLNLDKKYKSYFVWSLLLSFLPETQKLPGGIIWGMNYE